MPYDENIAKFVWPVISRRKGFDEKKMFGGVGYLLNGNMCCGVWKQYVILRLGVDQAAEILKMPYVKEFDITGKVMKGWAMVEPDGFGSEDDLKKWIRKAIKFANSLPAK